MCQPIYLLNPSLTTTQQHSRKSQTLLHQTRSSHSRAIHQPSSVVFLLSAVGYLPNQTYGPSQDRLPSLINKDFLIAFLSGRWGEQTDDGETKQMLLRERLRDTWGKQCLRGCSRKLLLEMFRLSQNLCGVVCRS